MKYTTTNYGKFLIDGYTDVLTIHIIRKCDETPQELVKMAIQFANEFKCSICEQVEYTYEDGVNFKVKCNGNTSRFIYDYGKYSFGNATATAKDIKAYKAKFGTDGCIHKGFVKKYWYRDPWSGDRLEFNSLNEALKSAATEYGNSVAIMTNIEMHNQTRIECIAKASGTYLS